MEARVQGAAAASTTEVEVLKKKHSAEFSTWVIGGQYTKNHLKRSQQLKPPQPADDPAVVEQHRKLLERRREQLRHELESHHLVYEPRVAEAMRVANPRLQPASEKAGTEGDDGSSRRVSPRRVSSRERPISKDGKAADEQSPRNVGTPRENDPDNTSSALRGRLKASFAQITATHAYGTLFPPLLTPYSRPCLLGQNATSPKHPDSGVIPDASSAPPKPRSTANELSVVANVRKRHQPRSGPMAFFPTGASSSVYRHFMHVPPAERGTFALGSR